MTSLKAQNIDRTQSLERFFDVERRAFDIFRQSNERKGTINVRSNDLSLLDDVHNYSIFINDILTAGYLEQLKKQRGRISSFRQYSKWILN